MNVLIVDAGTSSMRGVLMNEEAEVLFQTRKRYHPEFCSAVKVIQNPLVWKKALTEIGTEVQEWAGMNQKSIDAVSLTAQRTSVMLTDQDGNAITDAVMWQDKRNLQLCRELRERNVYINAPDWHYMAGASMGVMGYVEAGFNVTPLEQLIYGRSMSYYGTFEKLPSMGWTLVPLSPYQGSSDSSFWPYNEKIMEYDFMVGMNMLSGVVGSYRGGNGLYQEGASQNVMETWGEFYNKYRDILGGDIIHIAPPYAFLHNS